MTNKSNVPGDAVHAFVYKIIAAHLGLFVLSEGESLYIYVVSVIDVFFSLCSLLI